MKKKLVIFIIIFILFVLAVSGIFLVKNLLSQNVKKDYLDGIYVTSQIYSSLSPEHSKMSNIDVISFYSNNVFSSYSVTITEIQNIGTIVSKGQTTTGSYILSNESNTVLLIQQQNNLTYTFENNYKTLKNENCELNLLEGNIDDYIPKDTINNRHIDFSGKYMYEKVEDYQPGTPYSGTIGRGAPTKVGTRYTMDFNNNGTVSVNVVGFQIDSNNKESIVSWGEAITRYYSINKDNNELFVYSSSYPNSWLSYEKYSINDDLSEITTNREELFKLVQ